MRVRELIEHLEAVSSPEDPDREVVVCVPDGDTVHDVETIHSNLTGRTLVRLS